MKSKLDQQYQQTLQFLYRQLPMFQRVGPAAMKKDLGNIQALVDYLGQPHEKFPSVHIAGTNGKGTTAHLISAICQSAGYKVGVYTSPHYKDFRERIKINGKLMSKRFVVDFVEKHREFFTELQPSFFEITVAMAFEYFREQKVDIAIIETGLGGRLDSTNIIRPILSVITNISFDHQQFLGDTLPAIAGEKAGIIKEGIPVVIGEEQEEVREVFIKKAKEMNAPLSFASRVYRAEVLHTLGLEHSWFFIHKEGKLLYKNVAVNLRDPFQAQNLQTALQAVDHLAEEWEIKPEHIFQGLKELKSLTYYIGRWHKLGENPLIIADSAHNEAGLRGVLNDLPWAPNGQIRIVLGVVNDKDLEKILPFFPQMLRTILLKPIFPEVLMPSN